MFTDIHEEILEIFDEAQRIVDVNPMSHLNPNIEASRGGRFDDRNIGFLVTRSPFRTFTPEAKKLRAASQRKWRRGEVKKRLLAGERPIFRKGHGAKPTRWLRAAAELGIVLDSDWDAPPEAA